MSTQDEEDGADVVSLEGYRADRVIEEKLVEVFSFVPGIEELVREMLEHAKTGVAVDPDDLMGSIRTNLEAEVLRLLTEDESMVTRLSDLVLQMMHDNGIDFDDDEPYEPTEVLSPEEQAAHRLLQARLSPEDQQELAVLLRQAQFGHEDADSAISSALTLAPDFYETHLVAASIELRRGTPRDALKHVNDAERLCPGSPAVAQMKAELLRALGDRDGALLCFDDALQINSWHQGLHRKRGYLRYIQGDIDGAKQDFQWLLDAQPIAEDYFNMGNIHADLGDMEQAADAYRHACELDAHDAQSSTNLGSVLAKLGDLESAVDAWNRASDIDPYYALPYSKRGSFLAAQGRQFDAVVECIAALVLAPEAWPYLRETTICLELSANDLRDGDLPQSTATIETVLNRFVMLEDEDMALTILGAVEQTLGTLPDSLRLPQGVLLLRDGYPEEAAAIFGELLKLDPNNPDALFFRGVSLLQSGRPDDAVGFLERAMNLRTMTDELPALYTWDLTQARMHIAEAYLPTSPEKADEVLSQVNDAEPPRGFLLLKGSIALELGELESARSFADQAIDDDAFDGSGWYLRAQVRVGVGDVDNALVDLETAIELEPTFADHGREDSAFAALSDDHRYQSLVAEPASLVRTTFRRIVIAENVDNLDVWAALHRAGFAFSKVHQRSPRYVSHVEFCRPNTDSFVHVMREPIGGLRFAEFAGPDAELSAAEMHKSEPNLWLSATDILPQLSHAEVPDEQRLAFARLVCVSVDSPELLQESVEVVFASDDPLLRLDLSYFTGPEAFEGLEDPRVEELAQSWCLDEPALDWDTEAEVFTAPDCSASSFERAAWELGFVPVDVDSDDQDYTALVWVNNDHGTALRYTDSGEFQTPLVSFAGDISRDVRASLQTRLALGGSPKPVEADKFAFQEVAVVAEDAAWRVVSTTMLELDMVWTDGDYDDGHHIAWSEWTSGPTPIRIIAAGPDDVKIACLQSDGPMGTLLSSGAFRSVQDVVEAAQSESAATRMRAMRQLGGVLCVMPELGASALEAGITDPDPMVRIAALEGAVAAQVGNHLNWATTLSQDLDAGVSAYAKSVLG